MGSKPAPLLVLARYGRLQKSQEQKTKTKKKNQLHRFLYKTGALAPGLVLRSGVSLRSLPCAADQPWRKTIKHLNEYN